MSEGGSRFRAPWPFYALYAAPALALLCGLLEAGLSKFNPEVTGRQFLIIEAVFQWLVLATFLAHLVSLPVFGWVIWLRLARGERFQRSLILAVIYYALLVVGVAVLLLFFTEAVVIEPIIWAI